MGAVGAGRVMDVCGGVSQSAGWQRFLALLSGEPAHITWRCWQSIGRLLERPVDSQRLVQGHKDL